MPKVSIAVPVYNCEQFVAQSGESLLAQTYGDFELVISDNASTDNSVEVARQLASEDARDPGGAHATNRGRQASYTEALDRTRTRIS